MAFVERAAMRARRVNWTS